MTPRSATPGLASALSSLVAATKRAWRGGTDPNAVAILKSHPSLLRHRSLVIDLVYEEYCLREEAGMTPDLESFCASVPAFQSQIREVLRGHRELFDNCDRLDIPWPNPKQTLEGLLIERELGRGAFARVYLAHDPAINRTVVVKLSPQSTGEGVHLGTMNHPHIVDVLWARKLGLFYAVAMPYLATATLGDVLANLPNPVSTDLDSVSIFDALEFSAALVGVRPPDREAALFESTTPYQTAMLRIFARLAAALAAAHQARVAHGDLKPANVLIGNTGNPYLIDFNLASVQQDSTARCGGTLPYMAPERIRFLLRETSDPGEGPPADVFSFASLFCQGLTGRLPITFDDRKEVPDTARDILELYHRGLQAPASGIPPALRPFLEQAWSLDPSRRPTMLSLVRAIETYLASTTTRPRSWFKRQWFVATTGVCLTFTGMAAGNALFHNHNPVPAPVPASWVQLPSDPLELGIVHLKSHDVPQALSALTKAYRANPNDGRTIALYAQALLLSGNSQTADQLFKDAIATGYQPAWVHNNRAHCLLKIATSARHLELAEQEANKALAVNRQLLEARVNLLQARYRRLLNPRTKILHDPDCLRHLAQIQHEPLSPEVSILAALVSVASAKPDNDQATRAVQFLSQAVARGRSPDSFHQMVEFNPLATRDDFQVLLNTQPIKPGEPPIKLLTSLADPFAQ